MALILTRYIGDVLMFEADGCPPVLMAIERLGSRTVYFRINSGKETRRLPHEPCVFKVGSERVKVEMYPVKSRRQVTLFIEAPLSVEVS